MLSGARGRRLCLLDEPAARTPLRGAILFAPPFAEEMNKSRRAIAVAARVLAAEGWCVMRTDLEGCGDSSGEFENARWEGWQADLCESAAWLAKRGTPVRVLWGLRLGALLAADIVGRVDPQPDLLLWQPVLSGKSHLTQFLRLKAAEQMLNPAGERGATSRLRSELAAGKSVEVAGYKLNPALAAAIDGAELELPSDYRGTIVWLETGRTDQAELTPASTHRIAALEASGRTIATRAVLGASFWQTVEVEECPTLVEATAENLRRLQGPVPA